jgi:hypothetical protein
MRAVDIGDVMSARPVMKGRQRQGRHGRPEIGPADADVDDVGYLPARCARRRPGPNRIGKRLHRIEHGVDVGHDILAVEGE